MKKIAVLMSLFLLVMSSCSKSEESGKQPAPRQPKRPNICVTESPDDSKDDIQQHRNAVNQQQ